MRRIRWKSKYLTGEPKSDDRNKRLVAILHELYESLRAKEHCQDMEELYGELAELTERRLSSREVASSGAASRLDSRFSVSLAKSPYNSSMSWQCS